MGRFSHSDEDLWQDIEEELGDELALSEDERKTIEENGKKRSLVKTDVLVLREGEEVLLHDVTFPVLAG